MDPGSHKGSDGNSPIGPITIRDAIPRTKCSKTAEREKGGNAFPVYFHLLELFAGLKRKYTGNPFPLLNRPSSLFMHVMAIDRCLFRGFERIPDAHVDGIDDGDAGGKFLEVCAVDKIGDEGVDGQRAQ